MFPLMNLSSVLMLGGEQEWMPTSAACRSFGLRGADKWWISLHATCLTEAEEKISSRCFSVCAMWLFYSFKLIQWVGFVGNKCIFLQDHLECFQRPFEDWWELKLQSVAAVWCFLCLKVCPDRKWFGKFVRQDYIQSQCKDSIRRELKLFNFSGEFAWHCVTKAKDVTDVPVSWRHSCHHAWTLNQTWWSK